MTAHEPRLARVAAMIAEPARARMLAYLLDGALASASELARAGGVQPSTASAHIARLVDAGLVLVHPRGRHRYVGLADAEVAHALQALALVAERDTHDRQWAAPERQRLREARCCYGHLAGRLGVGLWQRLQEGARVEQAADGWSLTAAGRHWLAQAFEFEASDTQRRTRFAYGCLDWSERRDHLAGSLGRALLEHFVARGWLRRRDPAAAAGGHRVLDLTPTGRLRLLPALQDPRH
jgi:DNA-binding transcriptional ArsR family regulator